MLPDLPNSKQLSQYVVNREGDWEGIRQQLYDHNIYLAAGQPQLTFFALPVGQGVSAFGGAKTFSDTNMTLAGQLPANQAFLVTSLEVRFYPTTPTPAGPVLTNLPATAAVTTAGLIPQNLINDAYIFYRAGNLQFLIGSKPYLQEAPLCRFPPKSNFRVKGAVGAGADTTTPINEALSLTAGFATAGGRPYNLNPANLLLQSNQNFNVTLNWPEGLQAVTSAARVGVFLDGFLYRMSQ